MYKVFTIFICSSLLLSCSNNKLEEKGFSISESSSESEDDKNDVNGIHRDSIGFETRPQNVLLTGNEAHRLVPIYKVNYNKKEKEYFIGSNSYHTLYDDYSETDGNNWNHNFMPGFEAMYGYNLINVSHIDLTTQVRNNFFKNPVLIKTLYYPTFSKDTLIGKPIKRTYYMVSAYDEDTNKDGFINFKDLRRFFYFDLEGNNMQTLIPSEYSVMSSEYDPANDYMYVVAKLDQNKNGKMELNEPTHIFWIDLNNPELNGRVY